MESGKSLWIDECWGGDRFESPSICLDSRVEIAYLLHTSLATYLYKEGNLKRIVHALIVSNSRKDPTELKFAKHRFKIQNEKISRAVI